MRRATMATPRKRLSKPDPTKLTLAEILAAVDQLYVAEKYQLYSRYGAIRRRSKLDSTLLV